MVKNYKVLNLFTNKSMPNIDLILKDINEISMNYVGNKRKILGWIYNSLQEEKINLEDYEVLDAFTGSGSFSVFSKKCGCPIIVTNDLMTNAFITHKCIVENDEFDLSIEDKSKLLNHEGIYKELLDYLDSQNYKWFEDTDEKKKIMIDYVEEKSLGNKYLEFMLNYVDKFFTLRECIELASFREFIDKNE